MSNVQPGILASLPRQARHMFFHLSPDKPTYKCLRSMCDICDGEKTVVGMGPPLVFALGKNIKGLRTFPHVAGPGFEVPSTPFAIWCWLRDDDRGKLVHRTRLIERTLSPAFRLEHVIDAFQYGPSRDLTGYEDGTENPKGAKAEEAAVVRGQGASVDGSSFVAVQQWAHNLDHFEAMTTEEQDNIIGRRKSDNEELKDAPPSAHVKRTAQESFEPEAIILRRSMPWADATQAGLVFVAFGKSYDAFEALLRRMVGTDDGITDALFRFTRPISGAYFWCPPTMSGRLDIRALGV
jgi:porphyrinogen peroxidase